MGIFIKGSIWLRCNGQLTIKWEFSMKIKLLAFIICGLFALPAVAAKPAETAERKAAAEQRKIHEQTINSKEMKKIKNEIKKEKTAGAGKKQLKSDKTKVEIDKHREKKSAQWQDKKQIQQQKELDKGSEQGKESRANRRKWWKFWGE